MNTAAYDCFNPEPARVILMYGTARLLITNNRSYFFVVQCNLRSKRNEIGRRKEAIALLKETALRQLNTEKFLNFSLLIHYRNREKV